MLWKEVEGSIWSIHYQKSTLRYVNTITNNLLWLQRNNQHLVGGRTSGGMAMVDNDGGG